MSEREMSFCYPLAQGPFNSQPEHNEAECEGVCFTQQKPTPQTVFCRRVSQLYSLSLSRGVA